MRTAPTLFVLAALAACTTDRPEITPSRPEAASDWTDFAAQHPNILVASPEATNYAPPGWPLEPGDAVAVNHWGREAGYGMEGLPSWEELDWDWGWTGGWGIALVWVIGDSGPAAAQPFVARFSAIDFEDGTQTYVGHGPAYIGEDYEPDGSWAWEATVEQVPAPLRGLVDLADHTYGETWFKRLARRRELGGPAELFRREREPFFGEGASW